MLCLVLSRKCKDDLSKNPLLTFSFYNPFSTDKTLFVKVKTNPF